MSQETERMLDECCARFAPAVIMQDRLGVLCQARFSHASPDSIELELLPQGKSVAVLPVQSDCCVCFHTADQGYSFHSQILTSSPSTETSLPKLTLKRPDTIALAKGRSTFRVPVLAGSELEVTVATDQGTSRSVRAIDISLAGILVEAAEGEALDLPMKSNVHVSLKLGAHRLQLLGEVRRCTQGRFGLLFQGILDNGIPQPPEALRSIVKDIEMIWLRDRKRSTLPPVQARGAAEQANSPAPTAGGQLQMRDVSASPSGAPAKAS